MATITQEILNSLVERVKVVVKREGAYNFTTLKLLLAYQDLHNAVKLIDFQLDKSNDPKIVEAYNVAISELEKHEKRHEELLTLKEKYPDPFKDYSR